METIIDIKDGRIGNLGALLFLYGLSGLVIWAIVHWRLGWVAAVFGVVVIGIWFLVSLIFVYRMFRPKRRTLRLHSNELVWSVKFGSSPEEQCRTELGTIRKLRFVHARVTAGEGPDVSQPSLVFVLRDGSRRELPSGFLAGSYRKRIETALRKRIPGLAIEDTNG